MTDNSANVTELQAQLAAAEEAKRAEEVKRQIAEGKQRAAEEEKRAAEEGKRVAEEGKRAAETSLDAVTRPTTFGEYLDLYQCLCATQLRFDSECPRNTKGGVTNPRDRTMPVIIAPWVEFGDLQTETYQHLCAVLQDKRLFPNERNILGARSTIQEFLITSELALASYVNGAEVPPIKEILLQFIALGSGDGNSRLGVSFTPRGDPEEGTKSAFAPVDGVWNRGGQGSDQPMALTELKPPHKLTVAALQTALDDGGGRALKRFETKPVINSPHVKNDSTYLITAVFTQIFDYMIEAGTEFAYLNTGMACVYFQIREKEPTVLYYSLLVSARTEVAPPESTAICQTASFLCRCLTAVQRDQEWIRDATESNPKFRVDPEAQLALMSSPMSSASETVTPGKEDYKPPTKRKRQTTPETDPDPAARRPDDSEDDGHDRSPSVTRQWAHSRGKARLRSARGKAATTSTDDRRHDAGTSATDRLDPSPPSTRHCGFCILPGPPPPYCTQACLLGLTNSLRPGLSRALDQACPNVGQHSSRSEHELTSDLLCDLLRRQLARYCDHGMDRLKIRGAMGHLFRMTLCSHGYTFVAKAIIAERLPALTRELAIYDKLRALQGRYIPVCLGLIGLEIPYILPYPNHLTHLLLLSYAGVDLYYQTELACGADELALSAETTVKELHGHGLTHGDVRTPNMIWNDELSRVFMVDFERSDLPGVPPAPRPPRYVIVSPPKARKTTNPAIDRVLRQSMGAQKRKRGVEDQWQRKMRRIEERQIELGAVRVGIMEQLSSPKCLS
jgi:hypothetical protein